MELSLSTPAFTLEYSNKKQKEKLYGELLKKLNGETRLPLDHSGFTEQYMELLTVPPAIQ